MTIPRRELLDEELDALVPNELQHLSSMHWTPVRIAIRATSLLCTSRHTRVLDVGAGIGKLCTIGALSGEGTWVGVEQHALLVDSARQLARSLGVAGRTWFFHADVFSVDWSGFESLYFYNPFEVPLFGGPIAHSTQVARVQARLACLPKHTRVVTLHGFGGDMPSTFELTYHEHIPTAGVDLALWIQRSRGTSKHPASDTFH